MAAINYPVTGPPLPSPRPADGSTPLRLELRELQQNHPDQWNLYLLGLDAFQKQTETNDLSYYGIAGIHGRPYRPWGGVKGDDSAEWQGYCTHSSILFAPWHRPYLALYEQVLYGIVQNIAASFPESTRARYVQAASTFRIPYWDWAAIPPSNDQYFPNAVGASTTISVITPKSEGKKVSIANPLYTYHFNPINPQKNDFPPRDIHSQWPNTLRYPTSLRSASAKSQENMVYEAVQSQFDNIQSNVNLLMNDPNYRDFAAFSNHEWAPDAPGTYGSLENVHDSIHGEVGGNGGQMGDLDYAAFDPVFWLHHANVDRLFAIWQALNPTSYAINQVDPRGTFTIAANTTETAQTPLQPFNDHTGTKTWDSQGVRETQTFAYAYPETQKWKFASAKKYRSSVQATVQKLYGGVSNEFLAQATPGTTNEGSLEQGTGVQKAISKPDVLGDPIPSDEGELTRGDEDFEAEIAANAKNLTIATPAPKNTSFTHYIANLRTPKHVLGQTYRVHIFLGPFTPETPTWHTQEALVGTLVVLARTQASETENGGANGNGNGVGGCGKCKKDKANQLVITGTVPLTAALINEWKKGNLGGLEKENVLPYLTQNLHWRVTLADGTELAREEVPGLKVSVVSTEVALQEGLPVYSGVYEVHTECTQGRPAGHCDGDQM